MASALYRHTLIKVRGRDTAGKSSVKMWRSTGRVRALELESVEEEQLREEEELDMMCFLGFGQWACTVQ